MAQARCTRHRRLLVLAGEADWCRRAATDVLHALASPAVLWISAHAPDQALAFPAGQARQALGREWQALVFDAHDGFDPDALGAVGGTVVGGGVLLLLTPPLAHWPDYPDPETARIAPALFAPAAVGRRFLHRFVRLLAVAEGIAVVAQDGPLPPLPPASEPLAAPAPQGAGDCLSDDQARAVAAVMRVATGRRRRPVVLSADRGRGKSAAFGIAAARLLRAGISPILVTAPRLEAVAPVFAQAGRLLPRAAAGKGALHWGGARLEFCPPDQLLRRAGSARLVLVDEAAAIPAPVLQGLLERYARLAFATTVHGYEGTGRGFATRFKQVLDARTPLWKALALKAPVRWAADDPVERFLFRALLLDAVPAPAAAVAAARPEHCALELLDRDALAADEALLRELFGLLVQAHYRTRPYDLRYLLDGPNIRVYAARCRGHVVATALVATEGGFDAAAARAIWANRSRPHGHLLPETLAAHLGLQAAPLLRADRIMRIAVHPAVQGRGIGTALAQRVAAAARRAGRDYLGSSFGATAELMAFWERLGCRPVRVSHKRGAASGAHAVVVMRALSDAGCALYRDARRRYLDNLPLQLADPLRDLDPALAAACLRRERGEWVPPALSAGDWCEVAAAAAGRRLLEACPAPVQHLAAAALADPAGVALDGAAQRAALLKLIQHRPWAEVAAALALPGRAQVTALLRQALHAWVRRYGDAGARQVLAELGG